MEADSQSHAQCILVCSISLLNTLTGASAVTLENRTVLKSWDPQQ